MPTQVNYNYLESSFLVSGVIILILGMVFTSKGFAAGSFGYNAFTSVAALFIVGSSSVFAALLVFEVRRTWQSAAEGGVLAVTCTACAARGGSYTTEAR